jgi:hypothetical protein
LEGKDRGEGIGGIGGGDRELMLMINDFYFYSSSS